MGMKLAGFGIFVIVVLVGFIALVEAWKADYREQIAIQEQRLQEQIDNYPNSEYVGSAMHYEQFMDENCVHSTGMKGCHEQFRNAPAYENPMANMDAKLYANMGKSPEERLFGGYP